MKKSTRFVQTRLSGNGVLTALLFLLFFSSCEKNDITPLTGDWMQTSTVSEGTMISTLHFLDNRRYLLNSQILTIDNKVILQACTLNGSYSAKNSGLTFRVDGQTFDWAKGGYVKDNTLVIKDAKDKSRLVFTKLN